VNLVDVMEEIGEALRAIDGLRVHTHPVDRLEPPAAVVQFPVINYDQSFGRGTDIWEGGIVIAVSRVWDRAARDNIAPYVDGSGSESVHAALRAHDWQTCAFARATRLTWPAGYQVAGVDFVAARFDLDIAGPGT